MIAAMTVRSSTNVKAPMGRGGFHAPNILSQERRIRCMATLQLSWTLRLRGTGFAVVVPKKLNEDLLQSHREDLDAPIHRGASAFILPLLGPLDHAIAHARRDAPATAVVLDERLEIPSNSRGAPQHVLRAVPYNQDEVGNSPAPVISVQPQGSNVTAGATVTFQVKATGAMPLLYQWFKNTPTNAIVGATNATYVISSATTGDAGPYMVKVSNSFGMVLSSNAILTLPGSTNLLPVITVQPGSTNLTVGATANFKVTATGSKPLLYQWFRDTPTNTIAGATNASYVIGSVREEDAGAYLVRVSNAFGSVFSTNALLTVQTLTNRPPVITGQPQSTNVTAGATVVLQVRATGSLPLAYQWFKNTLTNVIYGATNPVYSISSAQPADAGSYRVRVSNAFGSVFSTNALLTVQTLTNRPPVITGQPQSTNVAAGTTVVLQVRATGSLPLAYQWFRNTLTNVIYGATNPVYSITSAQPADAGSYWVRVSNAFGSVFSTNAIVAVQTVTNRPPVITAQPQSTNVTAGATAVFRVTATGSLPLLYQWFRDTPTNAIAGATNSFYRIGSAQPGDAGSYWVAVSNAFGTVYSTNAVLTVYEATRRSLPLSPRAPTSRPVPRRSSE